jgi:hypothetical protein
MQKFYTTHTFIIIIIIIITFKKYSLTNACDQIKEDELDRPHSTHVER